MAKNRYKNAEPHRLIEGRMRVLEAVNRKLYRVEIWALNDLTTANGWRFTNLEAHLKEFQDIPILTAYLKGGRVIGDGHNYEMKTDPRTGKEYASFTAAEAERIVGWVPKDANIRLEKQDGTSWIVVTGYLWSWYSHELVEKIVRQGDGSPMEVSIETLVTKEHKDGDVDVEEEYIVLGITRRRGGSGGGRRQYPVPRRTEERNEKRDSESRFLLRKSAAKYENGQRSDKNAYYH